MKILKKERTVYSFIGAFILFLVLLVTSLVFGFGLVSPYAWLIQFVVMALFIFVCVKINKKFGLVMSVVTALIFYWVVSHNQMFCWSYGVPENEINQMVEISCATEDCNRYNNFFVTNEPLKKLAFDATHSSDFVLDEPPEKTIIIGKGFKTMIDCEYDVSFWQMVHEVFTENW